ncbi:Diphthamide synthase domain [Trinorchestia longiramus]|nr:Diphthamide synthase domain [Trinorchestia longiramus]
MRVVGLLSGGKDSCYALMQCIAAGHKAVAVATLLPPPGVEESNSHMYQSVGVHHVWRIAKAMGGVPLFSRTIEGKSVNTSADYTKPLPDDEVEDLFHLLKSVKEGVEGGVDGVSVGAILSDYQRVRVENVCVRLGLVCLSYLWQREQQELLTEMLHCGVEAVLVKAAGAGLVPQQHCGLTLNQLQPTLLKLNSKFDLHVCGEGGEFETFTTDCPLFEKRINIVRHRLVEEPGDVGYLVLEELALLDKQGGDKTMEERVLEAGVPGPSQFVKDVLSLQFSEAPLPPDAGEVCSETPPVPEFLQQLFRRPATAPKPTVVVSSGGWWLATGYAGDCVDTVLKELTEDLKTQKLVLGEACEVRAFVQSLAKYAEFNVAYKLHFGHGPPVRACVQSCIPHECQLEILGFTKLDAEEMPSPRRVLHVQSVSHWAPANIGPYSQAVKVGPHVWLAGMIGLVGGTLDVVEGGAPVQTALALRHVDRVLSCITSSPSGGDALRQLLQVICYSKSVTAGREAGRALDAVRCPVLHLVVQRLPKDADIELHCAANVHATSSQVTTRQCVLHGLQVRLQCMRVTHADTLVATLDRVDGLARKEVKVEVLVQLVGVAVAELLAGGGQCSSHLLVLTLFYAQDKVLPAVAEETISALKNVNQQYESAANGSAEDLPIIGVSAIPVCAIGRDGRGIAAVVINTLAPPPAPSA